VDPCCATDLETGFDAQVAARDLAAYRQEARRQGDLDRVEYRHGDFVQLADEIGPADIVTLVRVLCCYRDMPALVRASARRARRSYGVIYPRSTWWMRAAARAYGALGPAPPRRRHAGRRHGR
jgi:magnesium-protoporphyrin O-methyltransferase